MAAKKKREDAQWRTSGLAGNMESFEEAPAHANEIEPIRGNKRKHSLRLVPFQYSPASERRERVVSNEPIDISPSRVRARKNDALTLYSPRNIAVVPHHGFAKPRAALPSSTARIESMVRSGRGQGKPAWMLMHEAKNGAERDAIQKLLANPPRKRTGFRAPGSDVNLNVLRKRADEIIESRTFSGRVKNWRQKVRKLLRR